MMPIFASVDRDKAPQLKHANECSQSRRSSRNNSAHLLSCLLSHQSHPASLKLLIEAEGRQLLLVLEKNE